MTWNCANVSSSMALSSSLRCSASSILRYRLPATFTRFTPGFSELRFSSSLSPNFPKGLRPARAGKREDKELDEDAGNGTLGFALKDRALDEGCVVPTELHREATDAYMAYAYAMSVLLSRALPDFRDGLKPVHKRILYAMHELGLSSRKPYKKCARVVGEVLGKFHPHGDSAVYDSLVRMAQDFSLRSPLIGGHGNFGSAAAAMRYTECRLEVDCPNNSQKEPSVLRARLSAPLLNGASGIAVGMATNIPPHNLGELTDVLCALIHNPDATAYSSASGGPPPFFASTIASPPPPPYMRAGQTPDTAQQYMDLEVKAFDGKDQASSKKSMGNSGTRVLVGRLERAEM